MNTIKVGIRRARGIFGTEEEVARYDRPIPDAWYAMAHAKGYEVVARAKDRYHVALACATCGTVNLAKAFVLRTATPLCQGCLEMRWRTTAEEAGVTILRRCEEHRHYLWVGLPCGHEVRRQPGLIERAARGEIDIRCEICHAQREHEEAAARRWQRLGPDPEGNPNYRLYAHDCGHTQRIARANMQTGRFDCGGCGESWAAAASFLYLLRIAMPDHDPVIKLGYSRDPVSRMDHQLRRHGDVEITLIDSIPVPTGQIALCEEKKLHGQLRRQHPEHVIPPQVYAPHLKLVSEIYHLTLTPVILAAFEQLRQRFPAEPDPDRET